MSLGPLPLPDPPIRTPRLALRPWLAEDADALVAAWADPEVRTWTGAPARADGAVASAWIGRTPQLRQAGRSLDLVIDVAGAVAGEVGLVPTAGPDRCAEVGWWIAPERRGLGLATEAVRAFTTWLLAADGLGLDEVVARCATANPAAGRVAAAAGFEMAGAREAGSIELWRARRPPGAGTLHL